MQWILILALQIWRIRNVIDIKHSAKILDFMVLQVGPKLYEK